MLSQAGVLTVSSYPTRTSVVIRGKYVLQNILGAPPPPPPARRARVEPDAAIGTTGNRCASRWRTHRSDARSAPPATPAWTRSVSVLENYDGIGRVAHHRRQVPHRFKRHAAEWKVVYNARRFAQALDGRVAGVSTAASPRKSLTYALGRGLQRRSLDQRAVTGDFAPKSRRPVIARRC